MRTSVQNGRTNVFLQVIDIITVRNEVAKVMFLQASVCPRGGGGCLVPAGCLVPGGVCSVGGGVVPGPGCVCRSPPKRDGYCCGRYASYWNAFLLSETFAKGEHSLLKTISF